MFCYMLHSQEPHIHLHYSPTKGRPASVARRSETKVRIALTSRGKYIAQRTAGTVVLVVHVALVVPRLPENIGEVIDPLKHLCSVEWPNSLFSKDFGGTLRGP